MLRSLFVISAIVLLAGCSQNCNRSVAATLFNKDSLKTVLINVDKKYSDLSAKKGFYHARLDFLCENSVEAGTGSMPLEGSVAIEEFSKKHSDSTFSIEWKAVRAEVAASGELGYTFGGWTLKTKTKKGNDTIMYGNYITVWHKQADGSWKYVLDGGGDTPKPVTE
ncbi:MAG TPA: hypothetical protein VK808_12865 [Bacteroidia bacterium]|nr:hypothetical protein [Bacteroidia bacterium]